MKTALQVIWWFLLDKLIELLNFFLFLLVLTGLVGSAYFYGYYRSANRHILIVERTEFIDIHSGARIYWITTEVDEYICTKYNEGYNGLKK